MSAHASFDDFVTTPIDSVFTVETIDCEFDQIDIGPASEWGERIEIGRMIARGGSRTGYVAGATSYDDEAELGVRDYC